MSEQCCDLLRCDPEDLKQAMSIHTQKITDSCRDKDCIEDLRVYLTTGSQSILDSSTTARVRCAELLYTDIEVEPAAFNGCHYCIDITFYYKIIADAVIGAGRPACLYGLAVFSKRAVLRGEHNRAHIYRSSTVLSGPDGITRLQANLPTAVVEVLDPMVLSSCVREICDCPNADSHCRIPAAVRGIFEEELVLSGDKRRLFVTLGQFSIVRLERSAQLIVPMVDYAIPDKECCDGPAGTEDPCELFSRIPFPAEQFHPRGCDGQEEPCYKTC